MWIYLINRKAFLSDIPFPISDLRHIKTILSNILLVFNKLVLHEPVGCRGRQPLHQNSTTAKSLRSVFSLLCIGDLLGMASPILTETLYSSSFSTDINASCGTDTDPSCLIRFFPSFCFSNSFFFLVISPP